MAGEPIGKFGTTVDAVYRLAPEAERITDPAESRLNTPITEATVAAWITEVSDAVSAAIYRWEAITTDAPRLAIIGAARAVVANGVASYLEAARFPTAASLNESTYSGVLWTRYKEGVASLVAQLDVLIDDGLVIEPDPVSGGPASGPFGKFPRTYFHDNPDVRRDDTLPGDESLPLTTVVVRPLRLAPWGESDW